MPGLATASAKVASFGILTKIGLGTSVALGSVSAAGAAGVMPDAANSAVRGAIEVVTPVEFPDDAGGTVRVNSRSTGAVDGDVNGGAGVDVNADPNNPSAEVNGGVVVDGTLPTLPPLPELPAVPGVPGIPGIPGVSVPPLPELPVTVPTTLPELPTTLPALP